MAVFTLVKNVPQNTKRRLLVDIWMFIYINVCTYIYTHTQVIRLDFTNIGSPYSGWSTNTLVNLKEFVAAFGNPAFYIPPSILGSCLGWENVWRAWNVNVGCWEIWLSGTPVSKYWHSWEANGLQLRKKKKDDCDCNCDLSLRSFLVRAVLAINKVYSWARLPAAVRLVTGWDRRDWQPLSHSSSSVFELLLMFPHHLGFIYRL